MEGEEDRFRTLTVASRKSTKVTRSGPSASLYEAACKYRLRNGPGSPTTSVTQDLDQGWWAGCTDVSGTGTPILTDHQNPHAWSVDDGAGWPVTSLPSMPSITRAGRKRHERTLDNVTTHLSATVGRKEKGQQIRRDSQRKPRGHGVV